MKSTTQQTLSSGQMTLLNRLAHRIGHLGGGISVWDSRPACIFEADAGRPSADSLYFARQTEQAFASPFEGIRPVDENQRMWMRILRQGTVPVAVIFMDRCDPQFSLNPKLKDYCSRNQLNEQELVGMIADSGEGEAYQMLEAFAADFEAAVVQSGNIEKLSTELSQTYEQIILLYNLSTHMKVTQSNAEFLQYACDQLTELVHVEGLAIYLEKAVDGQKRLVLTAGCGYVTIDSNLADILQVYLAGELAEGKEALLDSSAYGPFKYNWPENVKSLIAVPLFGGEKMIGLMVATNTKNKPDFDSADIKLFNSVANECAVFIENGRLFSDLKDLFVGSLKALTNSIDAKDQYTRGHSERVAFISRWIAEHLQHEQSIGPDTIHYVYLAGLLHDIGKIGVAESVLRKRGKLTDEERAIITAHPRIGAAILSEIAQMRNIVPGVLSHHERYDGKGYPNGISGDAIPLIGRIIALADTFDAMTSKRVYRDAMNVKRAIEEIEKAAGLQFDPVITKVFLDSDIDKLYHIIQDGFIETWDYSNFSEYGAAAVGVLLR